MVVQAHRSDVLIIGGGIHGAALLWECTSRGLNATLLEQGDFCCATSANSMKIIHGGVRYLQDFDLTRLRAAAAERRALLRIAPHLVVPLTCVIPLGKGLLQNRLVTGVAFGLYDFLTCDRNRGLDPLRRIGTCQILSREELLEYVPWLRDSAPASGALWQDAQGWNTERLVLAFVLSAVSAGARAYNYVRAERLLTEGKRTCGVEARDVLDGAKYTFSSSVVVDCRGPWQAHVWSSQGTAQSFHFARAYNLLLKRRLADVAFGVRAPARGGEVPSRLLFCVPWREGSILGTWYDRHQQDPDALALTSTEVDRALAQFNEALPGLELNRSEVAGTHVGLLPCEAAQNRAGEPVLWKRHRILSGAEAVGLDGLVVVQGVKYTTARLVAEETVSSHVAACLARKPPPSRTSEQPLYGGDIADLQAWQRQIMDRYENQYGKAVLERLMRNHGSRTQSILDYAARDSSLGACVPGLQDTLQAEVAYVLDHECPRTLPDVIFRRLGLGSLEPPPLEAIEHCGRVMAHRLEWDAQRLRAEIENTLSFFEERGARNQMTDIDWGRAL